MVRPEAGSSSRPQQYLPVMPRKARSIAFIPVPFLMEFRLSSGTPCPIPPATPSSCTFCFCFQFCTCSLKSAVHHSPAASGISPTLSLSKGHLPVITLLLRSSPRPHAPSPCLTPSPPERGLVLTIRMPCLFSSTQIFDDPIDEPYECHAVPKPSFAACDFDLAGSAVMLGNRDRA